MSINRKRSPQRTSTVVRPKASARKSRSTLTEHLPRKPLQDRSLQRIERILAATEQLLEAANLEDISFYDIARRADISPSSINYFFPTMAALRIELTKKYVRQSGKGVIEAHRVLARMRKPSWQEWLRIITKQAQQAFNDNRPMSEGVLGPVLHRESRRAQIEENKRIAQAMLESFAQVFVMPDVPTLEHEFAMMLEISDALWSSAYIAHGRIDDLTLEETMRLAIAQLRTVLPEVLPLVGGQREPRRRVDATR
jgi:AcrR family transcriptional regulator